MIPEYSCAIIRNELGDVLLVYMEKLGCWGFPGGMLEPGENPDAAVIRELREELDVGLYNLVKLYEKETFYPESGKTKRGHYFNADADLSQMFLKEPDKVTQLKFMSRQEIKERLPEMSMAVRQYMEKTK